MRARARRGRTASTVGPALAQQPLDLVRLARAGLRVGQQGQPCHALSPAASSALRGPSGRSCWSRCASSRTASAPTRRACRGASRRSAAAPRGSCRRPRWGWRERRGSRKASTARMMQTPAMIAIVMARGVYPAAVGRKPGENARMSASPEQTARVRAPLPPRRPADVRRGVLGLDRRLQPGDPAARLHLPRRAARRRPARVDLVAERARGARRGRRHRPRSRGPQPRQRAPVRLDPAAAREDRARRLRRPAGVAAADLRRPARQLRRPRSPPTSSSSR